MAWLCGKPEMTAQLQPETVSSPLVLARLCRLHAVLSAWRSLRMPAWHSDGEEEQGPPLKGPQGLLLPAGGVCVQPWEFPKGGRGVLS